MRAIIHIGTEKTGTTSLQGWLSSHKDLLAENGFSYCEAAGRPNNVNLAVYAQADHKVDDLRMMQGITNSDKLAEFRRDLARRLRAEADEQGGRTMLFSSEHCHSRLITPEEVERLAELLRPVFDDIQVVVYLRRQDKVAVSLYSTMVRNGGVREAIIDQSAARGQYYDYRGLLDRWSRVFGEDRLSVRLFETGQLIGESIIPDFLSRLGMPVECEGDEARHNESLRPEYQEFLRRINERLPKFVDGQPNPRRGRIDDFVSQIGAGGGRKPPRRDAEAFYANFRADNEAIRQRWFPDRATLFTEDFDEYPESSATPALSPDALIAIFADLWATTSHRQRTLADQLIAVRREVMRLRARPGR